MDDVENLRKHHSQFEAKLAAQNERVRAFVGQAETLVKAGHSESDRIDARRQAVVARRMAVAERANQRRSLLNAALDWAQLKRDGDELRRWMEEKMKVAREHAWPDSTNVAKKLQKHEAFEMELRANADRIDTLNSEGHVLIDHGHYAQKEIRALLAAVNADWDTLNETAGERGRKLRQACDRRALDRTLDDANAKLDEMQTALQSTDVGQDLRWGNESAHTPVAGK